MLKVDKGEFDLKKVNLPVTSAWKKLFFYDN
jgi:hypothetical protein